MEEPRDILIILYHYREDICKMIFKRVRLDPDRGHIINGHTPIKVREGEDPIRGNGRLIVIDGGYFPSCLSQDNRYCQDTH